ncbi:MAG TPA: GAF domain-containing sensor histidine kinase [Myxococcaceae bacterium]|nr:GAF domain-containing sensor histidine kinase [Myxococcaceae bacterium]
METSWDLDVASASRAPLGRFLRHLYEIGMRLVRFEDLDRTLSALVELMDEVVPLRTVVLVESGNARLDGETRPRRFAWRAEGVPEEALASAEAAAWKAYAYLVGTPEVALGAGSLRSRPERARKLSRQPRKGGRFITLPLVSEARRIFGALQIQGAAELDEESLGFINAVANQLAIALDRDNAWRREVALREQAEALERRQRELLAAEQAARKELELAHRRKTLLADVSALMGASLDHRVTLPEVARLLVPDWVDCCSIDLLKEDGSFGRLALVLADSSQAPHLPEGYVPSLLATHPWICFPGGASRRACGKAPAPQRLEWCGYPANLRKFICVRGQTLGAISLMSSRPTPFTPDEVNLFEEVLQRVAISLDNALLYQRMQEVVSEREDLLATVSHDLQNPLLAISINADGLLQGPPPGQDMARWVERRARSIADAVAQTRGLVAGILDRARVQAELPLERQPQAMDALVDEALKVLRPLAASKAVKLEVEICEGTPPVLADPLRILQVLSNLIGGAIRATPPRGVIWVRAKQVEHHVRVSVRDSGPGISHEHLPHVFERFWQGASEAQMGVGLGLAIAKGIVEAHSGKIWVNSQPGVGTTFFFTLPLAR